MKYSDLFVYVLPEVLGCPEFTAERAIRDTCIDFCARTNLYRADVLTIVAVPNVTDYELDAPTGTEPNHVTAILRNGRPLTAVPYEDAFMRIEVSDSSTPQYYAQYDNRNLLIGPKPAARETLKAIYTLKPTQTSTSIPDTIGLEWREAIVSGSLFRLQMMSGQPWVNGAAAGSNAQIYERAVGAAIRQSKYGHAGAALTVTPREFI